MSKKVDIDKIVQEFIDKLIRGEKVNPEELLAKYPEYQDQLKSLLGTELVLLDFAQKLKTQSIQELTAADDKLWQKIVERLLAKRVNKLIRITKQLTSKTQLPLRYPYEYILLLLYVKGYRAQVAEGIRGITRIVKSLFLLSKLTDLAKLVKNYYQFVPYKLGPFEPKIYEDLKVLQLAGLINATKYRYKRPTLKSPSALNASYLDEGTIYTLTETGLKYAQALARWCQKKDPEILVGFRKIKASFSSVSLKKLLKYIYEHYPEYTTESEVLKELLNS
ncbi:MAG: hypothetical protein ABIK10_01730 [candidate division WOR-3 bacterium]